MIPENDREYKLNSVYKVYTFKVANYDGQEEKPYWKKCVKRKND